MALSTQVAEVNIYCQTIRMDAEAQNVLKRANGCIAIKQVIKRFVCTQNKPKHCSPPQTNSIAYGEARRNVDRGGAEALKLRPSLHCLPLTDILGRKPHDTSPMTYYTKPWCHRENSESRTKPRPQLTRRENFVKFVRGFETCQHTDEHVDHNALQSSRCQVKLHKSEMDRNENTASLSDWSTFHFTHNISFWRWLLSGKQLQSNSQQTNIPKKNTVYKGQSTSLPWDKQAGPS